MADRVGSGRPSSSPRRNHSGTTGSRDMRTVDISIGNSRSVKSKLMVLRYQLNIWMQMMEMSLPTWTKFFTVSNGPAASYQEKHK